MRFVMLVAALVVLVAVGVGLAVAMTAASGPEPRPTPTRVYSSCLAADTRPLAPGDDPCEGPGN
ncbi:hypothetical protein ACOKM3_02545 [Streptomyces sp. BH106]|uniref:hypothetical protein n=1 Tax=Streptomyces sp. BH106 TaxID=3410409 RepID=UPI003CEC8B43